MNKTTTLFLTLCTLLIISITYPSKYFADNDIQYVSSQTINIRDSADPNGKVLGKMKYGDKVKVIEEQYGWSKIKYKDEDAWVASHLLTKQKPETSGVNIDYDKLSYKHDNYLTDTERSLNHFKEIKEYYKTLYHHRFYAWLYDLENEDNTNKWLNDYTIVLDPGHGGHDPGSTAVNGSFEKDLALNFSLTVKEYLEKQGAEVILTRDNDSFIPLSYRTKQVEIHDADAFISIHFNAFTSENSRGFSTHYYNDDESKTLATYFQNSLKRLSTVPSRGVSEDNYKVLRNSDALSLLLELGFITNKDDLKAIESTDFQNLVGKAITAALVSYFKYEE